jgi:hypothetical protein
LNSRRRFLQVGLAAAAALLAVRALEGAPPSPARPYRALDPASARIMAAIAPVVLAGALPDSTIAREAAVGRVVDGVDRAIAGFDAPVRDELSRLLGLLRFAPARLVLTGLWRPLEEARPADIAAFLARWRESRFDLLRAAYQALTQLVQAAWYDDAAAWAPIGYPGPPSLGARTSA